MGPRDDGVMTHAIAEAVRAYAASWLSGDLGRIVAHYDAGFTLHWPGHHRLSGTHRGRDASLTALAEFSAATGRKLLSIVDVMGGDTKGCMIARERFETPEGPVEVERVLIFRVKDGLLAECWLYDADQALIDGLVGR